MVGCSLPIAYRRPDATLVWTSAAEFFNSHTIFHQIDVGNVRNNHPELLDSANPISVYQVNCGA
jgi:hypothetical protein